MQFSLTIPGHGEILRDRVGYAVLVDGRVVEEGAVQDVLDHPRHAETRSFLAREEQG